MKLLGCLCTGLECRASCQPQHSKSFDAAILAFGSAKIVTSDDRARRGLRVHGVGLAAASAHLALGPGDLAHLDTGPTQIGVQACAVAAGAFDTHADESAETTQPGQEFLVAIRRGGKLGGAQKSTSSTERGDCV